jgi:serine/threonine protein kinase
MSIPGTPIKSMSMNDYEVQTKLGHGAYGEVLMAISKKTGKTYAIKIMNRQFISNCGKSLAIFREKAILKYLRHDNIVHLDASFLNQDDVCLLMEMVEGVNLGEIVKKQGRQDPSFVQMVLKQILSALKYMNDLGFYHGDLKPDNIMITQDYKVKMIDFGCANYFKSNEKNRDVINTIENFKSKLNDSEIDDFNGTSHYASPELFELGVNTWKDDLWSLGVLTYQLLTGVLPFQDATDHLIFNRITSLQYQKKPAVVYCLYKGVTPAEADFFNKLIQPAEIRLGCTGDTLNIDEILSHKFLNTKFDRLRQFPRIDFRRGLEIDRVTIFTYGAPKIGINLLKDYCVKGTWYLVPEKLVIILKSSKKIIFFSEDQKCEMVLNTSY